MRYWVGLASMIPAAFVGVLGSRALEIDPSIGSLVVGAIWIPLVLFWVVKGDAY